MYMSLNNGVNILHTCIDVSLTNTRIDDTIIHL